MLRKLGVAALAAIALGPVLAAPATAVEPAVEPAIEEAVEAEAPAVARAGQPGDGLTEVAVSLPLEGERAELEIADHGAVVAPSGVVALPSSPEMVILEDVPAEAHLAVRSRSADGWSPWIELVANPDDAPDGEADPAPGVGPIWIGRDADQLEVAAVDGDLDEVKVVGLHPSGSPVAAGIRAIAGLRSRVAQVASGSSFIRPRSAWATSDMGWGCDGAPTEARELKAMVVHHTATNTEPYAAADVPDIIRGFWRYHVGTRGWCDLAYNFLVDRFGGVWEGRQGGITKAIVGGHTFGFNSETTSVSQIGDLQATVPTEAMTAATARLVGWKTGYHGIDPQGTTTLTNRTGSTFRGVPNGGQVPTRAVPGHRDLGTTACPGQHTYDRLPTIRTRARTGTHLVGIYEGFLGSLPDPAAYLPWQAVAERQGLRQAALGLAYSPEYSGVLLDDLYQRVLGRPADESGKQYWLSVLASGTRIEDVGALFYGSEEYVRAAGSLEAWVELLYDNLLHREPEQSGRDYWVGLLRDGAATPPEVARGFYASKESRLDRVGRLYERFLGRQPDPAGQAHWADQLLRTDDIVLAVELSLSDEFFARSIA